MWYFRTGVLIMSVERLMSEICQVRFIVRRWNDTLMKMPIQTEAWLFLEGWFLLCTIFSSSLLLTLQAIDDEVNKNDAPPDPRDNFAWEDPHSQVQLNRIALMLDYSIDRNEYNIEKAAVFPVYRCAALLSSDSSPQSCTTSSMKC